jgi:sodium-dependent dicarboxylate transporter 2/3/5
MWISNTAATMMMLPIALSIIELLKDQFPTQKSLGYFTVSLLLGMAYAANIGGMTTLIGTPPNLVLAAFASESLGIELAFSDWMLMALPIVILLFLTAFLVNTRLMFPTSGVPLTGIKELVTERVEKLGKPGIGEKRVAMVFIGTALLWIFRSPLSTLPGLSFLNDPLIAIASAITLFVLPSGEGRPVLIWADTKHLPWDILLLFGGGLSMASALASSGVVADLGAFLSGGDPIPWFLFILILVGISIFLTEGMSNVALVSAFVPIIFGMAAALGGDPLELSIPVTLAASCAFMLPIATPPNAIIFSSEQVSMQQMMRAGFIMNILATLLIAIYSYIAIPIVFG